MATMITLIIIPLVTALIVGSLFLAQPFLKKMYWDYELKRSGRKK